MRRPVSLTAECLSLLLATGLSGCAASPNAFPAAALRDAPGPRAGSAGHGEAVAAEGPAAVAPRTQQDVFNFDPFGAVHVYGGRGAPRSVVLLLSGEEGWDAHAAALAQRLAGRGALVAGIDVPQYRASGPAAPRCMAPASDLENLSHYLQSERGLAQYLVPTVVGTGVGASLAYATLATAPEGLFTGAVSIGFCPETALARPVCDVADGRVASGSASGSAHGQGQTNSGSKLRPGRVMGRWIVMQGGDDAQCPVPDVKRFVQAVPGAELVVLPRTDHAEAPGPWLAQLDAAYARAAAGSARSARATARAPVPNALADLPLTVVPAPPGGHGQWFGVFLTGDGGWAGLDKGVSQELARHDIPIVGWDSLKYFWTRRTPDGTAHDLDRVVNYYARAWGRSQVLLIGYSQGADTMPFMINRLPPSTHALVGYTALLGISDNAVFEFHVANWLGTPAKGIPTAPELARWSGSPYLCLYGEDDGDAACADLTGHDGTALKLSGGHHFGGSYAEIAIDILERMPARPSEAQPATAQPTERAPTATAPNR